MNAMISNTLSQLKCGDPQVLHNLTLVPLSDEYDEGPEYLTLGEALKRGLLSISEKSESGSVPEVKVVNMAEVAVLLLDGEELVGAKQNRVLNSTVLLTPKSETLINVSCTEQGRWSYKNRNFEDSDVVMARNIRARKSRSVSNSLSMCAGFRSDQSEVWEGIEELSQSAGVHSSTSAMRDVFSSKEDAIQECLVTFQKVEGQKGFIFAVDGAVVGMDIVSRADAYAQLHNKLVKSYVIDSNLKTKAEAQTVSPECVSRFIERLSKCAETCYPSVGCGMDYRFDDQDLCGSALVYEETCIHAAFFAAPGREDNPSMRGPRQRRRFRM